jgi:putative MATE family efflux protein
MPTRPLTELPLTRAIYRLAWPAMASMMMVNIFNLVDAFWVGQLGTSALGGMTASAFVVWCVHAVAMLVGTGVNAVVARRIGQGEPGEAGRAGAHGLALALALALVVMGAVLPLQQGLFQILGLDDALRGAASAYLVPILYGFPAVTLWYTVEAIFRGSGDTRTPMVVLCVTLLLNALIDPVLIFGLGPAPRLGIAGAAWATVLAHGIGVLAGLALLRRRSVWPTLRAPSARLCWTLVRIGAPIAFNSFFFSVIYILLTPIIATFGGAAVAAVGVGHRVEGLSYFTCIGFATAASTLVGQHLGAGHVERAERAAWLSTRYAALFMACLSVAFLVGAPAIYRVFSSDPRVIVQGSDYLRIVALFETCMALELVLEGAFAGAGNSLPPMVVSVPLTALRIPAAYLLAVKLGLGAEGIYWAISVSTGLKGAVMGLWFSRGRWKQVEV